MEQLLLILDLDETLIYAASPALERAPDFETELYCVYKRPHLDDFLRAVLERYRVAVWTTSSEDYATTVIENIMPPDAHLDFAWARRRCTVRYDLELDDTYYVKNLNKVRRRGYDLSRVLVVDDTPRKHESNYGNLVKVRPFEGDETDDELPALLSYLKAIESAPNLRTLEKRGWRSAVT